MVTEANMNQRPTTEASSQTVTVTDMTGLIGSLLVRTLLAHTLFSKELKFP